MSTGKRGTIHGLADCSRLYVLEDKSLSMISREDCTVLWVPVGQLADRSRFEQLDGLC